MSLIPLNIYSYGKGLQTNKKPVLLPDQAWQVMENAYTYRERVKKREGIKFIGRLKRNLTGVSLGNTSAGPPNSFTIADIFTTAGITEANAQIATLTITVGAPDTATFTAQNNGTFSVSGAGVSSGSYVNFSTGRVVLNFTALTGGAAIVADIGYFPDLPGMGTPLREQIQINDNQTIWFDQKYAYIYNGAGFSEFIPGTTWSGSNSNFFWSFNWRGAAPQDKLFFVTNFNINDPIRYTDGITWTDYVPLVTATQTMWQALLIVGYYGRLLFFNTWEGPTASGRGGAANIQNRMRATALGSPIDPDALRTDIFGEGILLDAPTNEQITSARFIKNTLVVSFESTTWQLRYLGEYGQPFLWERVSADFGSDSTFSTVIFDNHMLAIGDKAITASNSIGVDRIDLDIPDQIFDIKNANDGPLRVQGVRDYQRELVFWNYPDANTQAAPSTDLIYPNKVLVYNYRNNTWAIFRDSVTSFGTFQLTGDATVSWDSTDDFWDDEDVFWDDVDTQPKFTSVVSSNQQGFVHQYGYTTPDEQSLAIESIDLTVFPISLVSPDHNLQPFEIIQLNGLNFLDSVTFSPLSSSLNGGLFQVSIVDRNTFTISKWNREEQEYEINFPFTPVTTATYVGGGTITLFPKLNIKTKDINLFQTKGLGTKLSKIEFLMLPTPSSAMSVILYVNASPAVTSNMATHVSSVLTNPPYIPASEYSWFALYATLSAQYFNINLTYNDDLMNDITTHEQDWTLYAINAWCRPGGKLV